MDDTTKNTNERKEQQISIRFPLEVLAAVKALAKQHERSFNGEVIWALREYMERHHHNKQQESR